MSTRSIVALSDGDGYKDGVYVHSGGSPTDMGPTLFALLEARNGDLAQLWSDIDSAKHGGWSSLNADVQATLDWTASAMETVASFFQTDPSTIENPISTSEVVPGIGFLRPASEDQPDRRFAGRNEIVEVDADWLYVLSPAEMTMVVRPLIFVPNSERLHLAKPGRGTTVAFNAAEPDWSTLSSLTTLSHNTVL